MLWQRLPCTQDSPATSSIRSFCASENSEIYMQGMQSSGLHLSKKICPTFHTVAVIMCREKNKKNYGNSLIYLICYEIVCTVIKLNNLW